MVHVESMYTNLQQCIAARKKHNIVMAVVLGLVLLAMLLKRVLSKKRV